MTPTVEKASVGPISGFTDYTPAQHVEITRWKKICEAAFSSFGFTPFEGRPFELKEFLQNEGGIGHQVYGVYRMADGGLTSYGLPFDHTVPLALYVAQHVYDLAFPYKRQHIGLVYRGEHAQAGRFRGFIQADVDIVDRSLSPLSDAECILTLATALKKLEVGPFKISLNHMSIIKALLQENSVPAEKGADVLRILDKMDKLPIPEIMQEIQKVCDKMEPAAVKNLVDTFAFTGDPIAFGRTIQGRSSLLEEGYKELMEIYNALLASGVPSEELCLNLRIIRGLDYYTGILFETHIIGKEQIGSIASGGRYCELIGDLNPRHKDIGGVGGAIGLTRLFDILVVRANKQLKQRTDAELFLGYRENGLQLTAIQLAAQLRAQGVKVDLYTGSKLEVARQLKHADKLGIPLVLMVMDKENFFIKRMEIKNDQQDVKTQEEAVSAVLSLRGRVTKK